MGKISFQFNQPKERVFNACIATVNSLGAKMVSMDAEYGNLEIITPYQVKFNGQHSLQCRIFAVTESRVEMTINFKFLDGLWDPTNSGKKWSNILVDEMNRLLSGY